VIDPVLLELVRRVPGLSAVPLIFYRDRSLPTVVQRIRHLWETAPNASRIAAYTSAGPGGQSGRRPRCLAQRRAPAGRARDMPAPMVVYGTGTNGRRIASGGRLCSRVPDWAEIDIPPRLPELLPTAQDQEAMARVCTLGGTDSRRAVCLFASRGWSGPEVLA
jgi:hypothetical protein